MPDLDVNAAIGQGSERLLHKVTENVQLCSNIMGIVSLIALTAQERGKNLAGIQIGPVTMTERRMSAKVTYSDFVLKKSIPSIPSVNSFMHFLKAEAEGLYLMIARNPDILIWIRDIVERMDAYAKHKGKKFEDLTFGDKREPGDAAAVFMDREDVIVMELDP